MKKTRTILMLGACTLLLAACGSNQASSKSTTSSSSQTSQPSYLTSKSQKLKTGEKTPQESVAIITTYAAKKYGGDWLTNLKQAKRGRLTVNLQDPENYAIKDPGQGVVYQVNGKKAGTIYVLGKDSDFYLYTKTTKSNGGKQLGHASIDQMITYINQKGGAKLVKQLATKATINDQRSGSESSTSSSTKSTVTTGKYGNLGTFTIPADLRGTWYTSVDGKITKYVITDHQISWSNDDENESMTLYKQDETWLGDHNTNPGQSLVDATKNWSSGKLVNIRGDQAVHTYGWLQNAGAGENYAVKTETVDGHQQKVLVISGGAEAWVDGIGYQSPTTAQNNEDTEFDDLEYR